ncbi:hypothetical protein V6Z11_A11G352600 [Gossypium hirsutum]
MKVEPTKLGTSNGLASSTTSSEAQPSNRTSSILVRSSGTDLSSLQFDNRRVLSLESRVRAEGMPMKLFPLRSSNIKEDRPEISVGISASQRLRTLQFDNPRY